MAEVLGGVGSGVGGRGSSDLTNVRRGGPKKKKKKKRKKKKEIEPGDPIMAQRQQTQLGSMRMWVLSLVSHSGTRAQGSNPHPHGY